MQITFSFDTDSAMAARIYQLLVEAHQADTVAQTLLPPAPAAAPAPKKAGAKPAPAAKAPPVPAPAPAKAQEAGPPNGEDPEVEDDMGLVPPSMSPAEAKEQALALVRQVYGAGHVAEVKALQKEYQVAKFYDVPVEKGHEFYARVMQLMNTVGLQA
jgi:hypothetical protein